MTSRSLDGVIAKIDNSNSNMNLYRNFTMEDRINLNSTPLNQNYTGSAQGLVNDFTVSQFQAFDYGRFTPQDLAQEEDCIDACVKECVISPLLNHKQCVPYCTNQCIVQSRKDFI